MNNLQKINQIDQQCQAHKASIDWSFENSVLQGTLITDSLPTKNIEIIINIFDENNTLTEFSVMTNNDGQFTIQKSHLSSERIEVIAKVVTPSNSLLVIHSFLINKQNNFAFFVTESYLYFLVTESGEYFINE